MTCRVAGARGQIIAIGAAVALAICEAAAAASPFEAGRRHDLQQEQTRDALQLELQQSMPRGRANLSSTDMQRLEQLQMRQRMDQRQLEQRQFLQRELMRNPDEIHTRQQQRLFRQERQLQLQRFELEQHELLQLTSPRLLQRAVPPGGLALP